LHQWGLGHNCRSQIALPCQPNAPKATVSYPQQNGSIVWVAN
jgi:hypothetical protein